MSLSLYLKPRAMNFRQPRFRVQKSQNKAVANIQVRDKTLTDLKPTARKVQTSSSMLPRTRSLRSRNIATAAEPASRSVQHEEEIFSNSVSAITKSETPRKADQEAIIIVGFPGVGKSTIMQFTHRYTTLRVLDEPNYAKGDEEKFLKKLLELSTQKVVLLLPAFRWIGTFLMDHNLAFASVYPKIEAKTTYMERYRSRGSSEGFIKHISGNWNQFHANMDFTNYAGPQPQHVEIEGSQYLEHEFSNILCTVSRNICQMNSQD